MADGYKVEEAEEDGSPGHYMDEMHPLAASPKTLDTRGVLSLSSLWDFLSSSPPLREGLKLLLLGGVVEFARRAVGLLWTSFVEFFFITAEFEDRDETFSKQTHFENLLAT